MGALITIQGMKQLLKEFDKIEERIIGATDAALYQKGNQIMSESKKIAPKKEGPLRASGYVTPPENDTVELGYGGAASKYAVRVHELPENSNWTAPGTGSKYLQVVVEKHRKDFIQWLKAKTAENIQLNIQYRRGRGGNNPESPHKANKE